jgi:hypothetical protein
MELQRLVIAVLSRYCPQLSYIEGKRNNKKADVFMKQQVNYNQQVETVPNQTKPE